MEHIGKYKGYNVYKTPKSEMKKDQERGVLYAVAETGELILNGEVVGKVAFASDSVTEYDDHKCYAYKYPAAREEVSMSNRRTYKYEDNKPSTVVDPTDLDKMINDFILAAREMEISDLVGEFKEA